MRSGKKAAFLILARDCGSSLPAFLASLEKLRGYFAESRVMITENNSRDGTGKILAEYRDARPGVVLDSFDAPEYDAMERVERMTALRNRNLDLLKKSGFLPDYVIILDADISFKAASVIRAVLHAPEDFAALFANGRFFLKAGFIRIPALYYDLFAFLPEGEGTESLKETEMLCGRAGIHRALRKSAYVRCRSAFGGIGVYRYDTISSARYEPVRSTAGDRFPYLCEHIPFNRQAGEHGALYICRGLKTLYEPVSLPVFLKESARNLHREEEYVSLIRLASGLRRRLRGLISGKGRK